MKKFIAHSYMCVFKISGEVFIIRRDEQKSEADGRTLNFLLGGVFVCLVMPPSK